MKRGGPDHPKIYDLAKILKVPRLYAKAWAVGAMESLWHYTAKFAIQGDIGRVSDEHIAMAIGWPIERAHQLVAALTVARWLDRDDSHRLIVHDWAEHCDDSVRKTLKNRGLSFIIPVFYGTVPTTVENFFQPPSLALPSLAKAMPEPNYPPTPLRGRVRAPKTSRSIEEILGVEFGNFTEVWGFVPRPVCKMAGAKAYLPARAVASAEEILAGVKRWVASTTNCPIDKIAHFATWLNGQRWNDEFQNRPALNGNWNHAIYLSAAERKVLRDDEKFRRRVQMELQERQV